MGSDPEAIRLLTAWADDLRIPRVFAVGVHIGECDGNLFAVGDNGKAAGGLQMRTDVWGHDLAYWSGLDGLKRSIATVTVQWKPAAALAPSAYEWSRRTDWHQKVSEFAMFWARAQRANSDAVMARADYALREAEKLLAEPAQGGGMNLDLKIPWAVAHAENYAPRRIGPGGSTIAPEAWVLHIAEGSFDGIASWFATPPGQRNPRVGPSSAHFSVAKDGRRRQHVSIDNTAFANGIIQDGYTARLIDVNGKINPNLWTVSCEHEGRTGEEPTQAMFDASTELCAWVFQTRLFPGGATDVAVDRDHIIRHADISPLDRARCPGWSEDVIGEYIARVNKILTQPVEPPPLDIALVKYGLIDKIVRDQWAEAYADLGKIVQP